MEVMVLQFLPVAEICILHASALTLVGTGASALFVLLPPRVTLFQFRVNGDRKGAPGNKNEIVKRADKFACFISFFFSKSQCLAVIHFTSSITSRDFMTHSLLFPKGCPPGMCPLQTPGPERARQSQTFHLP